MWRTQLKIPSITVLCHCFVATKNCCGPRELLVSFRVWQYCCLIVKCVIIPFENHSSSHVHVRKLLFVYGTYKSRKSNNMCSRPINLVLLSELQSLLFGWKPLRNGREHFVEIRVAFPGLVTLLHFSPKSCNKLCKVARLDFFWVDTFQLWALTTSAWVKIWKKGCHNCII